MKKTLVVLLALMMVFAFATTAMAADEQYVPYNDIADQDVDIQTAIERLSILGALKGYDAEGTKFAPSQLITREEFATIGVRIAGLEDQVALYASMASAFKDVEEGRWSEGYVNCANANGIMIGRGNGVFDPKANVTMQEVSTVLLRAVGYDDRLPGAWPSDYNTKAVNVGLTEYVDYIGPKAATRGEVASLVNEALDLYKVQYVEDSTAAGLGQVLGATIEINGVKVALVDKDNYMYIKGETNKDGNAYGISLLNQTFDADVVANVIFDDNMSAYSESQAWGFEDFADWELEAYYGIIGSKLDKDTNTAKETSDFATLYGISRGQDVTDLGLQQADLTINSKGEIIYIDLTSDIVRTADVTAAQEDDCDDIVFGQKLTEGGYGEIWYDADGDAYAAKDFSQFESGDAAKYGIVAKADDEDVIFKSAPSFTNLRVDKDDYAFYLVGEGFIASEDLEEGDVIYLAKDLTKADALAIVYRPVDASLDDLANNSIEIDDVVYGKIATSMFSYDQGNSFETYNYQKILDLDLEFSDSVAFVPAYAFANFAYFTDDLQHAGSGIIENYVIKDGGRLGDGDDNIVSGMNILFAGEKEATLVEFDSNVEESDIEGIYPVEGSYVEYTLNAAGELMVTPNAADFGDASVEFNEEEHDTVKGTWNTDGDRLTLSNGSTINDVYRVAEDAVIYIVESDGNKARYAFESAQALSYDDFLKLGNFVADGLEIIDESNRTINALYIRDAEFTGDIAYGIGLYSDGDGVHDAIADNFYILINNDKVYVDDAVGNDIHTNIGTTPAIVAYKTEGGKITSADDIYVMRSCSASNWNDWTNEEWDDNLGYNLIDGDIVSYEDGDLVINNCAQHTDASAAIINNNFTVYDSAAYVSGYDFNTGKIIDLDDLEDYAGKHVNIVYDDEDNMVYILVFADPMSH